MKTGFYTALSFVHSIALSTGASTLAADLKWPAVAALAAWILGFVIGLVPMIRTLALGCIIYATTGSWLAVLATFPIAFVLLIIESAGTKGLKRLTTAALVRKRLEYLPETTYHIATPAEEAMARTIRRKD